MKQEFIINRRKPGRPEADMGQLTYAFRLIEQNRCSGYLVEKEQKKR
ncbi:hypothetical protein [Sporosarcina globispora]|nr:hypothetical protein [Sporosarcina globispora]